MGVTDVCEASLLGNAVHITKQSQHKGSLLQTLLEGWKLVVNNVSIVNNLLVT